MTTKKVTIDPNDPIAKKAVYNLYRGILGNYNARANSIIDNLPRQMVTEDQGISKQLEGMARQSSQLSGNAAGHNQPPAAYNPPNEIPKGPCIPSSCPPPPPPPPSGGTVQPMRIKTEMRNREPPAAIQNAMLTKDKKPFTYLPGGLDLSEIKSPRMARRIERNALTPDNPSLPTPNNSQINSHPLPASAMAAMTPHLSVAVLPPVGALRNTSTPPPPPPMVNKNQFNTLPRSSTPSYRFLDSNVPTNPQAVNSSDNSAINFTPNRESEQYNTNNNSNQSPVASGLKQTPTSWLHRPTKQEQTNTAPWVRSNSSENVSPSNVVYDQSSRNFPVEVEVRPTIQNDSGTRVIPIQIEGGFRSGTTSNVDNKRQGSNENQPTQNNANNTRPWMRQNTNAAAENIKKQSYPEKASEAEYDSSRLPLSELRKLQLTQDDRAFMNRVKSQVDDDIFLHNETDPRYKGSVIPSRTFRMLQNMTDVSDNNGYRNASNVQQRPMNTQYVPEPKVETPSPKYIPPSERRVVEDVRKYTGSAIPSRSFKVLQAITATQPTGYPDETDF